MFLTLPDPMITIADRIPIASIKKTESDLPAWYIRLCFFMFLLIRFSIVANNVKWALYKKEMLLHDSP